MILQLIFPFFRSDLRYELRLIAGAEFLFMQLALFYGKRRVMLEYFLN